MIFLSDEQVRKLLDLDELVESVAKAMVDLSAGLASVPPRVAARIESVDASLFAMPAYCPSANVLSAKLVTLFPRNDPAEHPTHQATIIVFDPDNGTPLAVMDGTYITAARTAACSALSAGLAARNDASVLAILGTGEQARAHARAVSRVLPIREIRVWGRSKEKAATLADELSDLPVSWKVESGLEAAMSGADIVCACTHPDAPVIRYELLAPGMHVTSVGFSSKGREVDVETLAHSKVIVEDRTAASSPPPAGSNDLYAAIEAGVDPSGFLEIGEVVLGRKQARESADQITVYKSVGVAVQDAAAAGLVLASYFPGT